MKKFLLLFLLATTNLVFFLPATGNSQAPVFDDPVYLPVVMKSFPPGSGAIYNGDFEAGNVGWLEYEDSPFYDFLLITHESEIPSPIAPHDGEWATWLGGDSNLTTYIEQEITIPGFGPQLVYWYWIDSSWGCNASYGGVYINDTLVDQYQLCANTDTGGWLKRTVNLNAYAGQTVALRMISETSVNNYSSLYIDTVAIQNFP